MDTQILMQLGLTESEIKVYFALLELETSTVGNIIEKSRVPDSKIYSILEKLKEKGLASFVIKNNVKHFQAADPKNLVRLLNERARRIEEQKKALEETIIPQIEARRKLTEEKQEATVYEGYEGLKSAFNLILETLKRGEEYQVFMLGEALADNKVIQFFKNYHKKRVERGIRVKLLSHTQFRDIVRKHHKYAGMRIRYTDQPLHIGTFVFKGYVVIVVWGEKPTAFVIKSQKNYEYYKEFFENMWAEATA